MRLLDSSLYYFNPHVIPLFIAVGLIAILGGKVVATRRSKANLYFGAVCLSAIVWLVFTALAYLVRDDERLAVFWSRLDWAGVSFISISVYAFAVHFLNKERPLAVKTGYALAFVFALLTLTTNPMMTGAKKYPWGFFAQREYLWSAFFFVFFFGCMIAAFCELIIAYRKTQDPVRRNHIKYIIAAFAVAYLASLDFLPTYGIDIYPWGFAAITVFVVINAYAILRHHLMDINIVIRKTLLYSIVSAGLASIYAGAVTLLARLIENNSLSSILHSVSVTQWLGNDLKIIFACWCVANTVFSIVLGVFVLLNGPRKKVNVLWFFTCVTIAAWSLGIGMMAQSPTFKEAMMWSAVLYAGSTMIPVIFSHFVLAVLNRKPSVAIFLGYFVAFVLQVANYSGVLYSVKPYPPFTYYTVPLGWYPLFALYFFFFVIYSHWQMFDGMRHTSGAIRNQIKYIFAGTAIGFCGGSTAFFMVYNINIVPYGVFVVPVYILTISYAIFRHQLMDINVVIRKTLLYSFVSAALAGVYVGTITLLAEALGSRHGSASVLSSALAAIFITLLFNPIRIRTQRWIDRRFPREHLDPELLQETAGGFAHEMKRPLTKISLPAQLLLMELERVERGERTWEGFLPELKERLWFIVNQSIDAGYVIEAIRELSSSAAPFEPVDLATTVQRALAANKDLLEKNRVLILNRLSADIPAVSGRPKQLEIVFINLIKNAAEAMSTLSAERKRELRFEGKTDQSHVIVSIEDTGPGIKPEDHAKLFQSRYSTKGPQGTGLGLYFSKQIAHAHNATIEVFSQKGYGATFTLRLPIGKT